MNLFNLSCLQSIDLDTGVGAHYECVSRNVFWAFCLEILNRRKDLNANKGLNNDTLTLRLIHIMSIHLVKSFSLYCYLICSYFYIPIGTCRCMIDTVLTISKLNHQQYLPTDIPFFTFTVMLPDTEQYHTHTDNTYNWNYQCCIFQNSTKGKIYFHIYIEML